MPLFLTIFEGPTAAEAEPLFAIRDPAIITAVHRLILDRLAGEPSGQALERSHRTAVRLINQEANHVEE